MRLDRRRVENFRVPRANVDLISFDGINGDVAIHRFPLVALTSKKSRFHLPIRGSVGDL